MDVMKPVKNINSVDYPAGKYCQGQSDREKIYLLANFTTESFFLMNFPEQRRTRNFHCTIYLQKSETDRLNNIIVEGTNRKIFLLCVSSLKRSLITDRLNNSRVILRFV